MKPQQKFQVLGSIECYFSSKKASFMMFQISTKSKISQNILLMDIFKCIFKPSLKFKIAFKLSQSVKFAITYLSFHIMEENVRCRIIANLLPPYDGSENLLSNQDKNIQAQTILNDQWWIFQLLTLYKVLFVLLNMRATQMCSCITTL